jgi:hypothetical protein
MMCRRSLDIKQGVNDSLKVIDEDGLLASEWSRLDELVGVAICLLDGGIDWRRS